MQRKRLGKAAHLRWRLPDFLQSVTSSAMKCFGYTRNTESQSYIACDDAGLMETNMPVQHYLPRRITMYRRATRHIMFTLFVFFISSTHSAAFAETTTKQSSNSKNESTFLVATEKLQGSSFQHAVILLTHFSERGATGLTINRPSGISLRQALPGIKQLRQRTGPLYLGGPVNTNAIFVLLRTRQPDKTMHRIADDIYFSTGKNAFSRSFDSTVNIDLRTYAGYAGWAAGQLQNEISRGDWMMVHTYPDIIFEDDTENLWHRLTKRWTGKWI